MSLNTLFAFGITAGILVIVLIGLRSPATDRESVLAAAPAPAATSVRQLARTAGAGSLGAPPEGNPELVALGESLFFDPILSGNRDISCGSCHHPEAGSGDGLPLSVGTGGTGEASQRELGEGESLIPRNAPPLYNRGHEEWRTMFWDGRVGTRVGGFQSPAGDALPAGLDSVLAVQAMFPPTSRDEMRGQVGDVSSDGSVNEIGGVPDDDLPAIWEALTARVVSEPGYAPSLAAAFPTRDPEDLGFEDLANAIAAYEGQAFVADQSPWDLFLAGDDSALGDAQLRGAQLFYGGGGCSACHSGVLMTDQGYHATGVPQVGPGKGDAAPRDLGRGGLPGIPETELRAFRTPSLRNVALTGPWMHDGAYTALTDAVSHMLRPEATRESFSTPTQDGAPVGRVGAAGQQVLDEDAERFGDSRPVVDDADITDIVAFLESLTDPSSAAGEPSIPESVPSGLAPPAPLP